jgi:hypothetical protein
MWRRIPPHHAPSLESPGAELRRILEIARNFGAVRNRLRSYLLFSATRSSRISDRG